MVSPIINSGRSRSNCRPIRPRILAAKIVGLRYSNVFLSPRKMILILQFAGVHALALKVPPLSAESAGLD